MRSWLARLFGATDMRPARVDGVVTREVDGIRYDGRPGGMPAPGGVWRGWVGRVRRAVAAFGSEARSVEQRTLDSVPWNAGGSLTPASASQERALRMGPVFSAVRLIADTVSTLPLKAYRKQGDVRQPITTLPALFRDLDDRGELVTWLKRCVTSLMLRGNAYGYVTARDGMGYPTVIQWLDPSDVSCNDINPWAPIWYWQGRVIPSEDLLHIPWFVIAGKAQGLSPIEAFAVTTSTGLQAQEYGSSWFAAGGVPPGTFRNTRKEVNQQIASAISDRLVAAVRSRRPIVFGADWEYTPITVPPEQAQFIETMAATATQIAAIYGLPPEYLGGNSGDSLTYSTVEQNQIRLNQALRPLLVLLEDALSAVLPSRQQVRFNADATARADLKTRYEAYEIAKRIGLLDDDEIRALEDLPPLTSAQKVAREPLQVPSTLGQPALPAGSRRFDPSQPRRPDGKWGSGGGAPIVEQALRFGGQKVTLGAHAGHRVSLADAGGSRVELDRGELRSFRRQAFDAIDLRDGESVTITDNRTERDPDGRPTGVASEVLATITKVRTAPDDPDEETYDRDVVALRVAGSPDMSVGELAAQPGTEMTFGQLAGALDRMADMTVADRVETGAGPVDMFADGRRRVLRTGGGELRLTGRDFRALSRAVDQAVDDAGESGSGRRTIQTAAGSVSVSDIDGVLTIRSAGFSVEVDAAHRPDFATQLGLMEDL